MPAHTILVDYENVQPALGGISEYDTNAGWALLRRQQNNDRQESTLRRRRPFQRGVTNFSSAAIQLSK